MSRVRAWLARLGGLFEKQRRDRELDAELASHLEMHMADNIRAGMAPPEARRRAVLALGGVEQTKESYREQRGVPWLDPLIRDVRFGLRMLRKNPGSTSVALLTLALGVGMNTAIFTVAYATLLAPLPYPHPEQLVNVWSKFQDHRNWVSAGDFSDWKRKNGAFSELSAVSTGDFNVATRGAPEFIQGLYATPGYYRGLGNRFLLGRDFLAEEGEPGKDHVVILTYRLWRHLEANDQVIGRTIQINGAPYTVVGVFAPGVADRWDWELIVPLVFTPTQQSDHDSRYLTVTGRLKPGVAIHQAQTEMDSVAIQEANDYPKSDRGWGNVIEPFRNDFLASDRRLTLWLLLGAVGFLLLIACVNIANLLLSNGIKVAIRVALGAKPAAIFAQFITESLVLAILGGLLGVATGYALLRYLTAAIPLNTLPAEADLHLNVPILLILLAATTLAGAVFGCAPAWFASNAEPSEILKGYGRSGNGVGRHQLRRVLVIAEFALALPVLAGAGLEVRSYWNLTHIDLGIRTDHVFGFYLEPVRLLQDPNAIDPYYRRILAGIQAVPGVIHVSAMTYLPLEGLHAEMPFTLVGGSAQAGLSLRPNADLQQVTPDYFQTFGIRITKGRPFTDADNGSSERVALVNEVFASRYLAGLDPLKQRVRMEQLLPDEPQNGPAVEWQIVGGFHTVKSRGSREDNPEIDTPFWQEPSPIAGIGVGTAEDPGAMIRTIAQAVNAVDSQAALYKPRTMERIESEVLANDRFTLVLLSSFAMAALLLAAVGVHGLTAFSVAQRSHEIAVRMALGASRARLFGFVMKEGLLWACIGLGVGFLGAYFVGRTMRSVLFGVPAIDFPVLLEVGLILLFAALSACYVPARRAMRVDPMVALRYE